MTETLTLDTQLKWQRMVAAYQRGEITLETLIKLGERVLSKEELEHKRRLLIRSEV